MDTAQGKGSWWRWVIRGLAVLVILVIFLLGGVLFVAKTNQREVPRLVGELVKKGTGADLTFSNYHFSLFHSFPFLTLVLEDVAMRDPGYEIYRRELLRIDELGVQFCFWKLFRREFEVRSISVEGGAVNLFKNTDGSYSNTDFLRRDTTRLRQPQSSRPLDLSIDHVTFHNFTFRLVDSLRLKDLHFELRDSRLDLNQLVSTGLIRLHGDWYFHGLTFKFQNGAFLRDKEAAVDWQLVWDKQEKKINVGPSTLKVEGETYALSGFLTLGKPPHLKLVIDHPGIMLDAGLKIIADNIRNSLSKFSIDRPVQVKVVVEGDLIPGHPAPADLFFSVQDAEVKVDATRLSHTSFSGHFFNCDPDGPVNPHSGCLEINPFSARILDAIPIQGKARFDDLASPTIRAEGKVQMPLVDLKPALPPGKLALKGGQFGLDFKFFDPPDHQSQLEGRLNLSDGALDYLPTGLAVEALNMDLSFEGKDLVIREFRANVDETPVTLEGEIHDLVPFILAPNQQVQAKLELQTGVLDVDKLLPPKRPGQEPPKRRANKGTGSLNNIASTIQAFLDRVNAELDIYAEGLNVRGYYASDVTIKSRFLSNCPETGTAGCLMLDTLDARIFGDIPIGASLQLTDLDHPYMHLDLQLAGPLSSFNNLLPPEQIRCYEGDIDLAIRYDGLLDDYFELDSRRERAEFQGRVALHNASADYGAGKYHLRKANANIEIDENHLRLPSITLEINDSRVELEGQVDNFIPFLFTEAGNLQARLAIRSPLLNFNTFPLNNDKEKKGKVKEKKAPSSLIARKLAAIKEHLEADLRVDAGELIYRDFNAEAVAIYGKYHLSCIPGQDPVGCVRVDTFSARLFGNAPLQASFVVEDLNDPSFTIDAWVNMPLTDLNSMFPPEQLRFHQGNIDLDLRYKGQPHNHFDAENALVKADLSGEVVFSDISFDYVSKGYQFQKLKGDIQFDNQDVIIPYLEFKLNDNLLSAKGHLYRLIPFLFSPGRGLEVALDVEAAEFSLDRFSAPAKHKDKIATGGEYNPTTLTDAVNTALDSIQVDFNLLVDKLVYRNFAGSDLVAKVQLDKNHLQLQDAHINLGGGELFLEGQVSGLANNQPYLDVRANFREMDIGELFKSFDNFGFKDVSNENLQGTLNADLTFRAQADDNYDLDPQSMQGLFVLNVEDGALLSFPMMTNLKNFLTKYRDLENVRFGSLQKIFRLENQILSIDKFELASSVVSFKLTGTYDLAKRGNTDLLVIIPVANLFEGNYSQKALNNYFKRGHGPAILMRMTRKEEDGKLFVRPVLTRGKHRRNVEE